MRLVRAGLLLVLMGCASSGGSSNAVSSADPGKNCGSMRSVIAPKGLAVYSQPDLSSAPVASLETEESICVSGDSHGFRHAKLPNGTEGYVEASKINPHD
jgi:hypothetical protein